MGIKITMSEFLGDESEWANVEIFPDNTIHFPYYDIEHDAVLAEMGEEPSPAYEFYQNYTEHGILVFSLDDDLYADLFENSNYVESVANKTEKKKWAESICKHIEWALGKCEYGYIDDRVDMIHHIVDTFCDSISIDGKEYLVDDEGSDYSTTYQLITGTLSLKINKKECCEAYLSFYSSYGSSLPSDPELKIEDNDEGDDDIIGSMKKLYELVHKTRYDSSREFANVEEPYAQEEKPNPLEGFLKGKSALVVIDDFEISFVGTYKTEEQTATAAHYIDKYFKSRDDRGHRFLVYSSKKYREFDAFMNDEMEVEVTEGWKLEGNSDD